jgi:hypothetical protein
MQPVFIRIGPADAEKHLGIAVQCFYGCLSDPAEGKGYLDFIGLRPRILIVNTVNVDLISGDELR